MPRVDELLDRLEELASEVDGLDEAARRPVLELLEGLDALHRSALGRLAEAVGPEVLDEVARRDAGVAWLLDAYGVLADDRAPAEAALEEVRPYVESHGGRLEVLEAAGGIVRVRLSGACSGCTASAVTLTHGVEQALRERLAGFVRLEVEEEEEAPAHPPPGETLVQIGRRPHALAEVLEREPADRWPGIVRRELARWAEAEPEERAREASAWAAAVAASPEGADLAAAWLGGLLELDPGSMERLVRCTLECLPPAGSDERRRFRTELSRAMVRLHSPQWQRTRDVFGATAADLGIEGEWG